MLFFIEYLLSFFSFDQPNEREYTISLLRTQTSGLRRDLKPNCQTRGEPSTSHLHIMLAAVAFLIMLHPDLVSSIH